MITNPAMVSKLDLPRVGHPGRWSYKHSFADFGTEYSQQPSSPSVGWLRRQSKKGLLNHLPKQND